jgi:hypothetical protein
MAVISYPKTMLSVNVSRHLGWKSKREKRSLSNLSVQYCPNAATSKFRRNNQIDPPPSGVLYTIDKTLNRNPTTITCNHIIPYDRDPILVPSVPPRCIASQEAAYGVSENSPQELV